MRDMNTFCIQNMYTEKKERKDIADLAFEVHSQLHSSLLLYKI